MDKKQTVKTPLGTIQIGFGTTPSSGPSASAAEIGEQFQKAAEQKIVSTEEILGNEPTQPASTNK